MFKYTSKKIRNIISGLPMDRVFTTRELLKCGKRQAVDSTLYRMVKSNEITRLASGVFIRFDPENKLPLPSITTIAKIKAKAFGKNIKEKDTQMLESIGLIDKICKPKYEPSTEFYTDGCQSQFYYQGSLIKFKPISRRRFNLPDSKTGHLLHVIWGLGKSQKVKIAGRARYFERHFIQDEVPTFRETIKQVPPWILNIFYH